MISDSNDDCAGSEPSMLRNESRSNARLSEMPSGRCWRSAVVCSITEDGKAKDQRGVCRLSFTNTHQTARLLRWERSR